MRCRRASSAMVNDAHAEGRGFPQLYRKSNIHSSEILAVNLPGLFTPVHVCWGKTCRRGTRKLMEEKDLPYFVCGRGGQRESHILETGLTELLDNDAPTSNSIHY